MGEVCPSGGSYRITCLPRLAHCRARVTETWAAQSLLKAGPCAQACHSEPPPAGGEESWPENVERYWQAAQRRL
jgi:hypothetical protein